MDGVSALSLVAALVDISRFCFDFVQTAKEIHRAKNGLSRDLELESFTHEMTKCISDIQNNPARSGDSTLAALCSQMEQIAEELLHKLVKRRRPGMTTLRKIWVIGMDELMHPKQLKELEEKLCSLFDTVQMRFVVLLSDKSIEISSEIDTKTKELGASISQVYDMLHAFAEESRASRDNQHVQIEQRIEASTLRMLADGSATREQMRGLQIELVNEIRHNTRRQHDRNQFDHRVSKGYRRSVPDYRAPFRRRQGICHECGMPGHWAETCGRENLTCYRCHKHGHRVGNCRVSL